jgi:Ca2+-binding EF-hand superfamily protein
MYDFDNDGQITKDDVRVMLKYAPLRFEPDGTIAEYLQTQDSDFEDNETINDEAR